MGVVLRTEFTNLQGIDYKIDIYQDGYSADVNGFVINGFELSYKCETDDPTPIIIGSELSINVVVQSDTYFKNTFISDLAGYQQYKFAVKVYEDSGSGYEFFWAGWITQDLVEVTEQADPFQYKLKCSDGIGMLKNIDYTDSNIDEPSYFTYWNKLLINVLSKNNLDFLWGDTDPYLATSDDIWEQQQTYSGSSDPLNQLGVDVKVWWDYRDGRLEYTNCLEIIRQMCIDRGCRFYLSKGVYRFEQYFERVDSTFKYATYAKDYAQLAVTTVSYDLTINEADTTKARAQDNQISYLPALKYVEIDYEQFFSIQRDSTNAVVNKYMFTSGDYSEVNFGLISDADGVAFDISGNYWILANGSLGTIRNIRALIKCILKVTDINTGTTYYWDGSGWTTSSAFVSLPTTPRLPDPDSNTYLTAEQFNVNTINLPYTGYVTLQMLVYEYQQWRTGSNTYTSITPDSELWNIQVNVNINFNADGNEGIGAIYYAESSNTNVSENMKLVIGKTNIADGSRFGRIIVKPSSTYLLTNGWRVGNTGTYKELLSLICQRFVAIYSEGVQQYDGDIYHQKGFHYRLYFNGDYYLHNECTYNAKYGLWSGRWTKISENAGYIGTGTKWKKYKDIFKRIRINTSNSDLPDGAVGGVQVVNGNGQIDEYVEVELTQPNLSAGYTNEIIVPLNATKGILITQVILKPTGGTSPYNIPDATIKVDGKSDDIVNANSLKTALNNGKYANFTINEYELEANKDILLNTEPDGLTGDYSYILKIYFKYL